jgi:hypothetical protein
MPCSTTGRPPARHAWLPFAAATPPANRPATPRGFAPPGRGRPEERPCAGVAWRARQAAGVPARQNSGRRAQPGDSILRAQPAPGGPAGLRAQPGAIPAGRPNAQVRSAGWAQPLADSLLRPTPRSANGGIQPPRASMPAWSLLWRGVHAPRAASPPSHSTSLSHTPTHAAGRRAFFQEGQGKRMSDTDTTLPPRSPAKASLSPAGSHAKHHTAASIGVHVATIGVAGEGLSLSRRQSREASHRRPTHHQRGFPACKPLSPGNTPGRSTFNAPQHAPAAANRSPRVPTPSP